MEGIAVEVKKMEQEFNDKLEDTINLSEHKISKYIKDKENMAYEIEGLRLDKDKLLKDTQIFKAENEELKGKINSLKIRNQNLESDMDRIVKEGNLNKLNEVIKKKNEENITLLNKFDTLRNQYSQLRIIEEKKTVELKEIKHECEEYSDEIKNLVNKVKDLQKAVDQCKCFNPEKNNLNKEINGDQIGLDNCLSDRSNDAKEEIPKEEKKEATISTQVKVVKKGGLKHFKSQKEAFKKMKKGLELLQSSMSGSFTHEVGTSASNGNIKYDSQKTISNSLNLEAINSKSLSQNPRSTTNACKKPLKMSSSPYKPKVTNIKQERFDKQDNNQNALNSIPNKHKKDIKKLDTKPKIDAMYAVRYQTFESVEISRDNSKEVSNNSKSNALESNRSSRTIDTNFEEYEYNRDKNFNYDVNNSLWKNVDCSQLNLVTPKDDKKQNSSIFGTNASKYLRQKNTNPSKNSLFSAGSYSVDTEDLVKINNKNKDFRMVCPRDSGQSNKLTTRSKLSDSDLNYSLSVTGTNTNNGFESNDLGSFRKDKELKKIDTNMHITLGSIEEEYPTNRKLEFGSFNPEVQCSTNKHYADYDSYETANNFKSEAISNMMTVKNSAAKEEGEDIKNYDSEEDYNPK